MYVSRNDLLYLSLARAGGLPLHPERVVQDLDDDLAHNQRRLALLQAEEAERRRAARRERRAHYRGVLAAAFRRVAGSLRGRREKAAVGVHAGRLQGCG